jgi:hypothetical protein
MLIFQVSPLNCLGGNTFKIAWNEKSKYWYTAERLKGILVAENGWPTKQEAADHLCGCSDNPQIWGDIGK